MKKKTTIDLITESEKTAHLQRFEKILNENLEKGYVSIEEKVLNGIEEITFEI